MTIYVSDYRSFMENITNLVFIYTCALVENGEVTSEVIYTI